MKIFLISICTIFFSSVVFSHGYIVNSRSKLCADGVNTDCGAIQYEPQSVEGPDGFPQTGPVDGTIAAAGSPAWTQLNEQSPSRWEKNPISAGNNTFQWHFTANHVSKDWRYFITKPNWDAAKPLSRESFELTPFCTYSGNLQQPDIDTSHDCDVPERSGYHVILSVWDVGDTPSSFFSTVDVVFNGTTPPPAEPDYIDIGDINPSLDLSEGDVVRLRLFGNEGELTDQTIEMPIAAAAAGNKNTWPKNLAELINSQSVGLVAGLRDNNGNIAPAIGKNDVFALSNSPIIRTETSFEMDNGGNGSETPQITVILENPQLVAEEPLAIGFSVETNQALNVSAQLFFEGVALGITEAEVTGIQNLSIELESPASGDYSLVVIAERSSDQRSTQSTTSLEIIDQPGDNVDYKFSYPQSIGSYAEGDKVLGKDGNIYECIVAGWCNNRSAAHYSPGIGQAWNSAWKRAGSGPSTGNPSADHVYPAGLGEYDAGSIVEGSDNKLYRCKVPGWCNNTSERHYAPGSGVAWNSAWELLPNQ